MKSQLFLAGVFLLTGVWASVGQGSVIINGTDTGSDTYSISESPFSSSISGTGTVTGTVSTTILTSDFTGFSGTLQRSSQYLMLQDYGTNNATELCLVNNAMDATGENATVILETGTTFQSYRFGMITGNGNFRVSQNTRNTTVSFKVGSDIDYENHVFNGKFNQHSILNGGTGKFTVEKVGTNTWTLAGGVGNGLAGLTVSGGVLEIASDALDTVAPVLNGGTLRYTVSPTSNISGNGTLEVNNTTATAWNLKNGASGTLSLVKTGSGIVKITATQTHTGRTYVQEGTLQISGQVLPHSVAAPDQSLYEVYVSEGAKLEFVTNPANYDNIPSCIVLHGGTLDSNCGTASHLTIARITTYGGTISGHNATGTYGDYLFDGAITAGYSYTDAQGNVVTPNAGVSNLNAGNVCFSSRKSSGINVAENATLNVNAVITSSLNSNDINKTGTGTLVYTKTNTHQGATNVNAGTLKLAEAGTLGDGTRDTKVASGATLELANTRTHTNTLSINGTGYQNAGAIHFSDEATLVRVDLASNASINVDSGVTGTIRDILYGQSYTMTKTGEGTLVLASNTTTPKLSVTEGTLFLNGGTVSNSVTIASGASAIFSGTVNGNIVLSGTWLGLVDDTEGLTLNDGNLEFTDGVLELPTTGIHDASFDDLFTLGTNATLNGTSDLTEILGILNAALTPESAYLWNLSQDGNSIVANVDRGAVPEPASWLLLLFGLGVLLLRFHHGARHTETSAVS